MSTGTPVVDLTLSTGMRADSTSCCDATQEVFSRSEWRSLRAAPIDSRPPLMGIPRRVTSTSEEARERPVDREP
eukprot:scaffold87493_cov25-Tisochrysis_lutea.AAC.5